MKILLIDDDEINNFISTKLLRKVNPDLEIKCALNGRTGLELFNEFKPDIVLLDTNMPIMNGWDFLDAVKVEHKCKIYVLASSVFSNDINKVKSYSIIERFMSKPLSVDKIKEIFEGYENS